MAKETAAKSKTQTVSGAKVGTPVQLFVEGTAIGKDGEPYPVTFPIPAQIYCVNDDGSVELVTFSKESGVAFIDDVHPGTEPGTFALL